MIKIKQNEKINPAFEKNNIPICFAANNGFVPYTAVMIQSIINNANKENNYDIIVLFTDISVDYQNKVLTLIKNKKNISIRFIDISVYVSSVNLFTQSVYTGTKYTNEAYYRLLIPEIMSKYDKVLYFDGDMIALHDVAELYYTTDMKGYMLASSRDYAGISNCYIPNDPRLEYRSKILGLKNINNYIISGMLVFNPCEFNKKYTAKDLMQICSSRNWRQHDQDVLNVICEDSLKIIDGSWDYMEDYGNVKYLPDWLRIEYENTANDIKIVHYAGPRKPWKFNNSFKSDEFWDNCYQTPFFKIIFDSINKNYGYKNSILVHLFKKQPTITYTVNDAYVSNGEYFIGQMSNIYTQIDRLEYKNDMLEIEGFSNLMGIDENENVSIYLSVDGKINICELTTRNCSEYKFDRLLYRGVPFRIKMSIDPIKDHVLKIVIKIRGNHFIVNRNLRFNPLCSLNESKNKYYYVRKLIFETDEKEIKIKPANFFDRIKYELRYQKTLSLKNRLLRTIYYIHRKLQTKQIWLIADRYNKAGDNGEVLFRYLQKNKLKNVKTYFVVDKNSSDYKKLKKVGKVINISSKKFRLYLMYADKIISSHLDFKLCLNYNKKVFSDIMAHRSNVFLQHGITKDDISSIYSKFKQNIDLFITAAKDEYKSIINNGNYGLSSNEVKLTGFARFDNLINNSQKIITITPTWRQEYFLFKNGKWAFSVDFLKTNYYKEYKKVLYDKKLIKCLKDKGYKIEFVQHPLMSENNKYFTKNEVLEIKDPCDYTKIFNETSLLITDYSSTAFDVAYMRKPILYFQFDREEFFSSHSYKKGYFDYEKNGFGEVCIDAKTLINFLIEYINNDCKIKDKYKCREDDFFAFNDNKNCYRIVKEILKMEK